MSDVERPWVERRRSGPPISCPVCGAATMEVQIAGVITCRSAGLDHFEWRPDKPAAVRVESERVADKINDAIARLRLTAAGVWPHEPQSAVEPSADNQRYVNSLTSPHHEAQVETPPLSAEQVAELPEGAPVTVIWSGGNGPHDYVVSVDREGSRHVWNGTQERMRFYNPLRSVGTERFHTRVWRRDVPTDVIEAEVLGVDWRTVCASRLGGDAGRLAALHYPTFGRPPSCAGCDQDQGCNCAGAEWPCATASLALGMMKLTASDIAISSND